MHFFRRSEWTDGWMEEGSGCNSKDDNNPFFPFRRQTIIIVLKQEGQRQTEIYIFIEILFLTKTLVGMQCKNKTRRRKKRKKHNNPYSYLATFRVLSYLTAIMEKNRQITGYVIGIGSEYKPKVNITISRELI